MRIVLDNQQHQCRRAKIGAVVQNLFTPCVRARPRRACRAGRRPSRAGRADIAQRQIKLESAAHAGRAAQLDFAAQQVGKFAADGQAQARAAIFAAGAGVGLLEGLEDQFLFFRRNANAGVGHFEHRHAARLAQHRMGGIPAAGDADRQAHLALGGKFERVGQQVFQHLLQPFGVGQDGAAQHGIDADGETEMPRFRLMAEGRATASTTLEKLISSASTVTVAIRGPVLRANSFGSRIARPHLVQDGPWSEAIARHGTAAAAARQAGDQEAEAAALNQLGIVQRLSGDLPGAAESLETALTIFRAIGSRPGLAGVLHDLGVRRAVTGDFPAAAGHLGESLAICRELGDRRGQAYALYNLGGVWLATGDSAGAARVLDEALAIFRDLPDRLGLAHALWYRGETWRLTGDYPAAELALQEGLDISRDLGNQLGLANIGNDLGVVRLATGDYQGAEEALQTALAGFRDLGNQLGQTCALAGLGAVRRAAGQLSAALPVLTEALRIARQIDSPTMQANALYGGARSAAGPGPARRGPRPARGAGHLHRGRR